MRLGALFLFLSACATGATDEVEEGLGLSALDPNEVLTHEVRPSAALLTEIGDSTRLDVVGIERDGDEAYVDGEVVWVSSDPTQVAVNADGSITATTDVGAAVLTAYVDGQPSVPILVTIAPPVDGAVLVADEQVSVDPMPITYDENNPEDTEWVVTLNGLDAPAVGAPLIAEGSAPILGRVLSTTPVGNDVQVVYASSTLEEAFQEWRIDVEMPLENVAPKYEDWIAEDYDIRRTQEGDWVFTERGENQRSLRNLLTGDNCKVEGTLNANVASFSLSDLRLRFEPVVRIRWERRRLGRRAEKSFVVGGIFYPGFKIGFKSNLSAAVKGECKIDLADIPIPITGYLRPIVSAEVKMGLGVSADIGASVDFVEAALDTRLSVPMRSGFACNTPTNAGCEVYVPGVDALANMQVMRSDFTVGHSIANASDAIRLKGELGLFAYASLGFTSQLLEVLTREDQHLSLAEGQFGLRAGLDYATERGQVADPSYRSKASVDLFMGWNMGSPGTIDKIGGLLNVNVGWKVGGEWSDSLGQSPHGQVSLQAVSEDGEFELEPGKPVDFLIELTEGTRFLGLNNVGEIHIKRVHRNRFGQVNALDDLETVPVEDFQDEIIWSYTPSAEDLDDRIEFAFFVSPRVFIPIPSFLPALQISENAVIELDACGDGFNRLPQGDFEGGEYWHAVGEGTDIRRGLTEPLYVPPFEGDYLGYIGWPRDASQVFGNLRSSIGALPAGTYAISGKYQVVTHERNYYDNERCASLSTPALTIGIGHYGSEGWTMADSRSYTPGEYYCSYIDRDKGRQVGFNGWKDLPETTIVVDDDLNNAYAFFHTSGGVAQQEHFVVFDDLQVREVGAGCD